jgi:hypothetical protein
MDEELFRDPAFMAMVTDVVKIVNRRQNQTFQMDAKMILDILAAIGDIKTGYGQVIIDISNYRIAEIESSYTRRFPEAPKKRA